MKLAQLELGVDVVTPLGRHATVVGFLGERAELEYLDKKGDRVVLLPKLLKMGPRSISV